MIEIKTFEGYIMRIQSNYEGFFLHIVDLRSVEKILDDQGFQNRSDLKMVLQD